MSQQKSWWLKIEISQDFRNLNLIILIQDFLPDVLFSGSNSSDLSWIGWAPGLSEMGTLSGLESAAAMRSEILRVTRSG